jgi:ABC-2 type transport system permease protein
MTQSVVEPLTPAARLRFAMNDSVTVTRRFVLRGLRQPEAMITRTIMPLFFVVLFGYVFGSSITVPGGHYMSYLMSGMLPVGPLFSAGAVAVAVATDIHEGVVDLFRTMPIARSSVLVGRTIATTVVAIPSNLVLIGCAFAVGLRTHRGIVDTLYGFALIVGFTVAMNWVGAAVGLFASNPESASTLSTLPGLILGFTSNVYVDPVHMPAWLRVIAEWNPASAIVSAVRELFGTAYLREPPGAWPLEHPVVTAIVMIVVLIGALVPLSVRQYSRIGR